MRNFRERGFGRLKFRKCVILFVAICSLNIGYIQAHSEDSLQLYSQNTITLISAGNLDSAQYWSKKVILLAPQSTDTVATATILMDIAAAYEGKGQHILSIKPYLMAVKLLNAVGEDLLIGRCYLDLSNIAFRMGNNERSLEYCMQASSIYKRLNDTTNYISASMLIGQVYIATRKFDEALEIYNQMLELAHQTRDSTLIADNLDHIGVIYSFQEDYVNTLKYFRESQKINLEQNNVKSLAINYSNMGEIFMRQGNFEEGLVFLKKGLTMAQKSDFNSLKVYIYYTMGELYSKMNNPSQAVRNFQLSLSLISEIGEYRERPTVYKLMSEHFERAKKYSDALTYFKFYSASQDSLNSQSAAYQMAELTVIYDIDKVDEALRNEKVLSQKERATSAKTIMLQKIGIIISFIGLLITTTLGIVLYKSQQNLRIANKTREILISIIGHDLRGPMANINKLMEMLKKNILTEKDDYVRILEKPVKASYDLLQDLLTWSLIVNNRMTYSPQNVNLKEVVDKCFVLHGEVAKEKEIELISTIQEDLLVFADRNHLYTALRNLISNGIKFTPFMGKITVSCSVYSDTISIEVTDTGIGMDPDNVKRLLGNQTVFSTRGTKNEKGSGLGLLLTKECVRINRGVFAIKSIPGQGSTFSFTIPYKIPNKETA